MVNLQKQKATLKRLRNSATANAARLEARVAELDSIRLRSKVKPILTVQANFPSSPKAIQGPRIYAPHEAYLTTLIHNGAARSPSASAMALSSRHVASALSVRGRQKQIMLSKKRFGQPIARPSLVSTVRLQPRRQKRIPSDILTTKDIHTLRQILERDVVFVSLDTEFERRGLMQHVVEIGISILKTKELAGVDPGPHANNWFALLEHHHIVVDTTRSPRQRMSSSRFGKSQFLSTSAAKSALVDIFKSLASNAEEKTKLCFVGHSFESDLMALLRCPGMNTDLIELCRSRIPGLHVEAVVDTLRMGFCAKASGISFPNLQLGPMARYLGVDPVHFDQSNSLLGTHNALNDAAYTLFATLLMAVNWDVYRRYATPQGKLPSKPVSSKDAIDMRQAWASFWQWLWQSRTWTQVFHFMAGKSLRSSLPGASSRPWKP